MKDSSRGTILINRIDVLASRSLFTVNNNLIIIYSINVAVSPRGAIYPRCVDFRIGIYVAEECIDFSSVSFSGILSQFHARLPEP